jgi:hypothetical protein
MTFLIDASRIDLKCFTKDVHKKDSQDFESFLEFLKNERGRVLLEHEETQMKKRELEELQKDYLNLQNRQSQSDFVVKRKEIKSKIVQIEKHFSEIRFTIEEFDRNVIPFLDMYYKRK